ncbi:conserved oligomeric Golgi complex subunit 7-like isoform X3 [Eriocheir sinensis]|uniref:conserved oligomeric Golgi complex subunit 7-like isoform X3 n=1 Tax=Eriocheir sinensis TaxID=95602 RepID=UPI0021C74655|nr:conserved oligomeric Golgi complex subunit 7-like isoform X3 [Eriocheir sinensis]
MTMDLTAFSQENFDPKEWINSVFRSPEAQQNRDQYASSLVMRLQLAIQEVNGALEETSQQVVGSLPRVMRDIESLGHEVSILKNQMNSVRQDIEKVEHNTAASMQTLVKLDTLKGRMVASSQALREADNWTTLSTDIEEVSWCEQVFEGSDSSLLLSQLVAASLTSLDPPVNQVLAAAVKQQEQPLDFLIAVNNAGDNFLKDLENSLGTAKQDQEALYQAQRMVTQAVYKPLEEQITRHQEYHEAQLLSHLISADIVKEDMAETLCRLREYCGKIPTQAEAAAERCIQLSNGWSFPSLVLALSSYIEQCTARLAQAARHVQKQKSSIIDDWTVFTICLNLIQAAGELVMAIESMEHSLATRFTTVATKFTWHAVTPFTPTPDLLLSPQATIQLKNLVMKVVEEDGRLLEQSLTEVQAQCQSAVEAALSTIMAPVSSQLATLPELPAWTSRPGTSAQLSSSFSPQEYITQIGQYLMTLPQHLEPLLVNHSPALNRALQEANTASASSSTGRIVSESEISAADFLINSVGHNTCRLYTEAVLKIPDITASMVTQLTTDIDYVCNILEDLGVSSCEPLDQLNTLLKAPADQYLKVAPGKNPRLIAAVRQMRNIPGQS